MEIKGKANAPVLDGIAWYRGNSSEGYAGKGVDTSAWEEKQYPGGTAGHRAVAGKRPNDWGLYDMLGNVWEWCGDWSADRLPGGSVRDPTGAASGPRHVMRGGSWDARPELIGAAAVAGNFPGQREISLGFRPALAPRVRR